MGAVASVNFTNVGGDISLLAGLAVGDADSVTGTDNYGTVWNLYLWKDWSGTSTLRKSGGGQYAFVNK